MEDQEQDYLVQRLAGLEQANYRWKTAAVIALLACLLLFVSTGVLGVLLLFSARQAGRARQEAVHERARAEQAAREAQQQRALAVKQRQLAEQHAAEARQALEQARKRNKP